MDRVMIFIDGSTLYHRLVELYNGMFADYQSFRMDFAKFSKLLCGNYRRLVHTHYYNVPVRQADDPVEYARQQKFFSYLRSLPHLTVHLGSLMPRERNIDCPKCGETFSHQYRTEKGVDVKLASHMLVFAFDNQYDVAVLVSGDGDFAPVVEEVQRLGKVVDHAAFEYPRWTALSKACKGKRIELTPKWLKRCVTVFRANEEKPR